MFVEKNVQEAGRARAQPLHFYVVVVKLKADIWVHVAGERAREQCGDCRCFLVAHRGSSPWILSVRQTDVFSLRSQLKNTGKTKDEPCWSGREAL